MDLAMAYTQFRIREEDRRTTSFRVPGGQYAFRVGAFGLRGTSSVLMRHMNSVFARSTRTAGCRGGRLGPAHARALCGSVLR